MNVTGVPSLGQVDCLFTTPNPTFYYLQIQTAGDINIHITQFTSAGVPIDVDFIVWGPFNDLASVCGPAGGLDVNGPVVDCSYSAAPIEDAFIPNAQIGEYYLFLVTNYNGQAGTSKRPVLVAVIVILCASLMAAMMGQFAQAVL